MLDRNYGMGYRTILKSSIRLCRNSLGNVLIITSFLLASCNSKGIEREQYENGRDWIVAETLNGELDGKMTVYYENGVVKNISHYKNDVLHGESKWFDENGNIISIENMVDGKVTGEAIVYYPNGNTKSVIQKWDNKFHGAFVKFFSNGKKKIEGTMQLGKPIGEITSYDSLGNVISVCFYI
ncbi:toxin-antitoxin system YwqK family antitoxin [Pontibacter russatus]|uniref:toxin-antitoxin system YwqK family antitoxin n=1 Tax=Pontibacter russatus TaxID=2694929 RepID=UPI00137B8CFA|nr:toxin-antitoxin system YwqK family antitoxin [Pontibacter russatus]